ncbi:hypothetical protein BN7_3461 [Wickerhamomyces ciferrii]|uniref:25S rRNA (Uridine(2843)-N(3))-methyltransferase n=1 Tax=Wickerhamomyces ciferrii (strain ATCC 14091 / BCRC 22168 / CBS 111 / JCM 3599 / NBRC 0793 / NRRL Y-1031 F-60-10) TaxID=1206466 RepID=K0KLP5_WICCF|nr:uncharacterized protein BN7_3461 [Wickerhamomyces ciferrii]CCH43906.1 hypothetical protein BN7_3461 [Wickerhamomyces ciferrii]
MSKKSVKFEGDNTLIHNDLSEESDLSNIPAVTKDSLYTNDILKLFQDSFNHILSSPSLEGFIQKVKSDLYNRDYISAFGQDDKRMAYSARWTPSRALCYSSLFSSLKEVKEVITDQNSKVLCVGGGAGGELIGLSSVFTQSRDFLNKDKYKSKLNIKLIDIADWTTIVTQLTSKVKKNWLYDEPDSLEVDFINDDVISVDPASLHLTDLNLITLLFTTNELFAEDKAKSIRFFQALNKLCQSGAYLLISESAGSYSHITVGSKKFPIQFLIDTILLGKKGEGEWELVNKSDSCWYRCEKDYQYPMKIENMRFFFRLYRKK